MSESWRWQLRDAEGQWIRMGSRVKWLDRGKYRSGTVVGSPRNNIATVKPDDSPTSQDIDTRRITVESPSSQGTMEVAKGATVTKRLSIRTLDVEAVPGEGGKGFRGAVTNNVTGEQMWQCGHRHANRLTAMECAKKQRTEILFPPTKATERTNADGIEILSVTPDTSSDYPRVTVTPYRDGDLQVESFWLNGMSMVPAGHLIKKDGTLGPLREQGAAKAPPEVVAAFRRLTADPQSGPQGATTVRTSATPTEVDPYDRMLQHRARAKTDKEYGAAYRRGQAASKNFRGGLTSPLERADARGEPDAWYDGYHDHAAGLEPDPEPKPKPKLKWVKVRYRDYEAPGFRIYQESGYPSGGWVVSHQGRDRQEIASLAAAKVIAETLNADYDPVEAARREAERVAAARRGREQQEQARQDREAQIVALTPKIDAEITARDPLAQSVRIRVRTARGGNMYLNRSRAEAAEKIARTILEYPDDTVTYETSRTPAEPWMVRY